MEEFENSEASLEHNSISNTENAMEFKKPILVGKIGRLPKKIQSSQVSNKEEDPKTSDIPLLQQTELTTDDNLGAEEENIPLSEPQIGTSLAPPYQEPSWSTLPQSTSKPYVLEVLKSGSIVEEIDLMKKSYFLVGRSTTCDIPLAHPTISRFHAVLQYRGQATQNSPSGFYIYDLGSTHGSFLNKGRLKSRIYVPIRVGHMIKFGFSSRSFLLTGPEEDAETESEFTVTELKQQRAEKLAQQEFDEKEAIIKEQQAIEVQRKKEEERGVDWGLGEDAEEEPDLTENPYAQTNNEELYIEDPKKALRGFMEREGFNLDYDCSEHSFGQFLCKIELPLDDEHGRPIVAEVLHKGKKKEAVVQCALEACRILDRHGVLRQATHESRKRKAKNWEENDYYDSDDDTFLDRTGTIEKKRERRMYTKQPQQAETYLGLLEKESNIKSEIAKIEKELSFARNRGNTQSSSTNDEDALDSYMKELKDAKPSKQSISKLKSNLIRLKVDLLAVTKLAKLAKPTDLPQLHIEKPPQTTTNITTVPAFKKNLPLFGKRSKTKLQLPSKPIITSKPLDSVGPDEEAEEEEEDEKTSNERLNKIIEIKSKHETLINPPIQQSQQKQTSSTTIASPQNLKKTDQFNSSKINVDAIVSRMSNSDNENDDSEDDTRDDKELTLEELKKRQKRNQRRIKQRRDKAEIHKQKGYEEDAQKEDYNMWIPPQNQTGDGRTNLNEKFGY